MMFHIVLAAFYRFIFQVNLVFLRFTHNQHVAYTFTAVFCTSVVVNVCVRFSSCGHAVLHRPHAHPWLQKIIASHGSGAQDSDGRR